MSKLTDKVAFATIRSLGLSVTKLDGEYRIRIPGSPPDEGYFTTDLQDAVDTAKAMAKPVGKMEQLNEQIRKSFKAPRIVTKAERTKLPKKIVWNRLSAEQQDEAVRQYNAGADESTIRLDIPSKLWDRLWEFKLVIVTVDGKRLLAAERTEGAHVGHAQMFKTVTVFPANVQFKW